MTLNKENIRNNKCFNKKEQTKYKLQALKRTIQSCKDRNLEVREDVLQTEKALKRSYKELCEVKNNKGNSRIHKKLAMNRATDEIALVDNGKINHFEDY